MRMNIILRLILATVFALIAFIFSEVVPDLPPIHKSILRVLITIWFGLLGYGLFPDIARTISSYSLNLMNAVTMRISTEVMNQLMRISKPQHVTAPFGQQLIRHGTDERTTQANALEHTRWEVVGIHEVSAGIRADDEARRDWQFELCHSSQIGSFSSKETANLTVDTQRK